MQNQNVDQDRITVLVRDHDRFMKLTNVDDWDATTLLAAVSSDPRTFHELDLAWQRYRRDQRLEDLPWQQAAGEIIERSWLLIDLACQRIGCNDPDMLPGEPGGYKQHQGKWSKKNPVVWWNLPPWWTSDVCSGPQCSLPPLPEWHEPIDFRGVLYGRPLAEALAARMVQILESETETESVPDSYLHYDDVPYGTKLDPQQKQTMERWHQLTVGVHADWLMTPRDELGGQPPRHFLHAGRQWVDREVGHRRDEWAKFRQPPKPLDRQSYAYRHGPMGTPEVVMYFDLCRELLHDGWRVFCASPGQTNPD